MGKPLVSVLMPVYNSEKYVQTAIESILNQQYSNFEFIIIDDHSKDKTYTLIKKIQKTDKRIHLLRNRSNLGVTKSLNKGLQMVKGKYIVRMDSDDWAYPERISSQVELMESNPHIVVSGSYIEVCDENLNTKYLRKYHLEDKLIKKHLFRYSPFAHPVTIWRTEILKKEPYNNTIKVGQDYELYFRVGKMGEFRNLERPLLKLRMHNKSVSASMNNQQSRSTVEIRKKAVLYLGYKMTKIDIIYNFLQSKLIYIIPVKMRFILFNFLRRFDFI